MFLRYVMVVDATVATGGTTQQNYLMGPYNAGPKSELFLRVALINAGVRGAGVIRAILKREYLVFEKLSFFEFFSK